MDSVILQNVFFGNSLSDYLRVLLMFLAAFLSVWLLKMWVIRRLNSWAKKTASTVDDFVIELIQRYALPLFGYLFFKVSIKTLVLSPIFNKALSAITVVVITFIGIAALISTVRYVLLGLYASRSANEPDVANRLNALMPALTIVIWVLGLVFMLDNLGFKISTIMAGLGIGGVAVALAASVLLNDLFAYVAIMFDQPFVIGDFIVVDDYRGTIEQIGIKTTRIRSLGGELLVFSNKSLTDSRIRNYKRMDQRRIEFSIGITYDTPLSKLKEIPTILKSIIEKQSGTRFDRSHFSSYGDSSLNFQIVYFVLNPDYNCYMDIQQTINFQIYEEFGLRGIQFAFPTRTIFLQKNAVESKLE